MRRNIKCPALTTAIYLRVSTYEQHLDNQKPSLLAWEASACPDGAQWFEEVYTGTKMDRAVLEEIMTKVRKGLIKRVVCWSLDRLGRNAAGMLQMCQEFQTLGVTLISIKEGIDLSTPVGRLMVGILASLAQYENEWRRERQMAGMARARAEGKLVGAKTGRIVRVTQDRSDAVMAMWAQGMKIAKIARNVSLSRPTVYKVIEDRKETFKPSIKDTPNERI